MKHSNKNKNINQMSNSSEDYLKRKIGYSSGVKLRKPKREFIFYKSAGEPINYGMGPTNSSDVADKSGSVGILRLIICLYQ